MENLYKNEEVNVDETATNDEETKKELLEIFYYERVSNINNFQFFIKININIDK